MSIEEAQEEIPRACRRIAAELAELRARHEKLRKLVARRLGLIPPCLEIEEHAELNALLEDE